MLYERFFIYWEIRYFGIESIFEHKKGKSATKYKQEKNNILFIDTIMMMIAMILVER